MNRTIIRIASVAMMTALGFGTAMAVPAIPTPVEIEQPDGTKVTLSLRGDEYFHYFQTADGYVVKESSDGWYRIVDNDGALTEIAALDASERSAEVKSAMAPMSGARAFESLKAEKEAVSSRMSYRADRISATRANTAPSKATYTAQWDNKDGHFLREFPAEGQQKVLIILVNYTDVKWSYCSDPGAEMQKMLQEPGYSNYSCTGSAYDYFNESSRGIFQPEFDVYGPVDLPSNMAYYGANDSYGDDQHPEMMVVHALQALDSQVDFSQYDCDGDGVIDNVYVFYAGYGENEGASSNTVWPHSWDVRYAGSGTYTFDGVQAGHYACSNELTYNGRTISGIGTFCHEFSHVLGLPDLYATSYTTATSPGDYSLMDSGSYNNNGRTPPIYSGYERYALEWQKPYDITGDEDIRMRGLTDGGNFYKMTVSSSRPTEYFLFENRQPVGFDEGAPASGLYVWHIDYQSSKWTNNTVNNTKGDECVILVGSTSLTNKGMTTFTSTTNPAFKNKSGTASSIDVSNISEGSDGIVSFRTGDGMTDESDYYCVPPVMGLKSISPGSFTISFPAARMAKAEGESADKYYISIESKYFSDTDEAFVSEPLEGYKFVEVDINEPFTVEGVEPLTSYVVSVSHEAGDNISAPYEMTVLTAAETVAETASVLSVDEVRGNDATLSWVDVDGADRYLLTVATREETDNQESETCDFSGSPRIPSDWKAIIGGYSSVEGNYGEASPSAYLSYGDDFIWTNYNADKEVASVELWAKKSASGSVALNVYSATQGGSITLVSTFDVTTTGKTYTLDEMPEDVHSLVFLLKDADESTRVFVDDIKISYRNDYVDTPVGAYGDYAVSGTSAKVDGLSLSTPYVAYVKTHDGTAAGARSNTVKFTTTDVTGVESVGTENGMSGFYVAGGTLYGMDANASFDVTAIDGRIIGRNVTGSVRLPGRGVYVISSNGTVAKVIY